MEKGANGMSVDVATGSGILCRQYIRGSCRFGPNCVFSHELPVLPQAEICRYFQKGACWYGDRCRYRHILQPDGTSAGGGWGAAPPVPAPAAGHRALQDRRGSEPSISQPQGGYSGARRRSVPLLNGMMGLQQSFEQLSTDITEEEEQGPARDAPRLCHQRGSWSHLQHHGEISSWREFNPCLPRDATSEPTTGGAVVARVGLLRVVENQESGAERPSPRKSSGQQGTEQSGAGAPFSRDRSDEAFRRSKDIMCGICMDKVYEKPSAQERRFGILPNCTHAFCLGCIVTWRKTKDFQDEVIKACPQCRVKSSYYIPSKHWVSDAEEKLQLISTFKEKSSKIRCAFFMRRGCCPYKSECIYRHELPSGFRPRRRGSTGAPRRSGLEDLDSESLQLLQYIIAALGLLDEDDLLEEDDHFLLGLDDPPSP
ncbi:hypothetical protein GJAV_G00182900 [Gymnothorax javanicus]|nr:hypothetical protein GJAV_G00182900 [Gymnothorax javanicus]